MATATHSHKIMTAASLATLSLTPAALAHSPEFHGQPGPDSGNEPDQPASNPEAVNESTEDGSAVETVPLADDFTTSVSAPLAGVSIGLGDLVFGLMVVFPWLLMALRNQLHSQQGS